MSAAQQATIPRQGPPIRLLIAAAVGALVVALAAGVAFMALQGSSSEAGTKLDKVPAPAFDLTDQDGRQVSLADFRGRPVALTFLYTSCPDVCPLMADKLRQTSQLLGSRAGSVGIVAITTDPVHDDRAAAVRFTQEHEMGGRWHFLIGSPNQLAPIWKGYYIGVTPAEQVTPSADNSAGSVIHSDALFIIDKAGRERTLFGDDFQPKVVAAELGRLISE